MGNEDIVAAAIDTGPRRSEGTPRPLKRWRLQVGGWGARRFVMQSANEPPTRKPRPEPPRRAAPPHGQS